MYDKHWAVDPLAHNRDRSQTSPQARTSSRLKEVREREARKATAKQKAADSKGTTTLKKEDIVPQDVQQNFLTVAEKR